MSNSQTYLEFWYPESGRKLAIRTPDDSELITKEENCWEVRLYLGNDTLSDYPRRQWTSPVGLLLTCRELLLRAFSVKEIEELQQEIKDGIEPFYDAYWDRLMSRCRVKNPHMGSRRARLLVR